MMRNVFRDPEDHRFCETKGLEMKTKATILKVMYNTEADK